MTITLRAASATDKGKVRGGNEDAKYHYAADSSEQETFGLFLVADGMGGQMGGEYASEWTKKAVIAEFEDLLKPKDLRRTVMLAPDELATAALNAAPTRALAEGMIETRIRSAVQRANQSVLDFARNHPADAADAGSTLTMAVVKGSVAYVANVGDSRTYLMRDDELRRVTKDHSLVFTLMEAGQIKPDEIYDHPQRNLILRSLGSKKAECDIFPTDLQRGDRLLLCSDGLWEMVRDPQLTVIMSKAPSPQAACERLIKAANDNGGEDNISAVVVWVE